jgi:hypothetical protein
MIVVVLAAVVFFLAILVVCWDITSRPGKIGFWLTCGLAVIVFTAWLVRFLRQ